MKNFLVLSIAIVFVSSSAWLITQHDCQKNTNGENKFEQAEGEDYFFLQHGFPYGKVDYEAHRLAAAAFKKSGSIEKFLRFQRDGMLIMQIG